MARVHRLRPFHQLRVTADLPRNVPMNRQLCDVCYFRLVDLRAHVSALVYLSISNRSRRRKRFYCGGYGLPTTLGAVPQQSARRCDCPRRRIPTRFESIRPSRFGFCVAPERRPRKRDSGRRPPRMKPIGKGPYLGLALYYLSVFRPVSEVFGNHDCCSRSPICSICICHGRLQSVASTGARR